MTLTQPDLAHEIHSRTGLTLVDAASAAKAFKDSIRARLLNGDVIPIPGVGSFVFRKKPGYTIKERKGLHGSTIPKTVIPPHQYLVFRVNPEFRRALRGAQKNWK